MPVTRDKRSILLEEALPVLRSTPSTLRSLLADLPEGWLDFREDPEAWSPRLVLTHFIHNERMNWIPRARVILSETDERLFVPFQQMPGPEEVEESDIQAMLDMFSLLRRDNIETLLEFNLSAQEYERTGEHPVLGTVNLGQLLAAWVVHDLNHTHQIVKSLAKVHVSAVGPWRQYLAILDVA